MPTPNESAQAELKKLETYIQSKIESDFPIKVKQIVEYDQDPDDDLVGVFEDSDSHRYSFVIMKDNPSPILQRVG